MPKNTSFILYKMYHTSIPHFAPVELFLVFHSIMTTDVSPEVILLHDPGMCSILCLQHLQYWAVHEWICKLLWSSKICEDRLKLWLLIQHFVCLKKIVWTEFMQFRIGVSVWLWTFHYVSIIYCVISVGELSYMELVNIWYCSFQSDALNLCLLPAGSWSNPTNALWVNWHWPCDVKIMKVLFCGMFDTSLSV
jgi:hypothetical protein